MNLISQVKKTYYDLPLNLRRFLVRASILFIVWELLYNLLLKPIGIPDDQLTHFVVIYTYKLLTLFYSNVTYSGASIYMSGQLAIIIAPACNALELLVLYVGFLLCIPTTRKRFWLFTLGGLALVVVLNILRCAALAVLFYNNHPIADFAHHYLFKIFIYGVIFYLWILYSKKYMQNAA
ncbi:MAG: archaeosortase/exosortase family protein [Flavipsychrobacter sp.]|nr:archaeosortase/exosortase family protein [Flavipsychrobacter sp.]